MNDIESLDFDELIEWLKKACVNHTSGLFFEASIKAFLKEHDMDIKIHKKALNALIKMDLVEIVAESYISAHNKLKINVN